MQQIGVLAPTKPPLGKTAVAGLSAALVASLLWFGLVVVLTLQNTMANAPALFIGPAMGYAMYRAANRQGSVPLQVTAGILALLAIGITETFVIRVQVARQLADTTGETLGFFLPLATYWKWLDIIVAGDGLTQLIFITTLWAAIYITRDRIKQGL